MSRFGDFYQSNSKKRLNYRKKTRKVGIFSYFSKKKFSLFFLTIQPYFWIELVKKKPLETNCSCLGFVLACMQKIISFEMMQPNFWWKLYHIDKHPVQWTYLNFTSTWFHQNWNKYVQWQNDLQKSNLRCASQFTFFLQLNLNDCLTFDYQLSVST